MVHWQTLSIQWFQPLFLLSSSRRVRLLCTRHHQCARRLPNCSLLRMSMRFRWHCLAIRPISYCTQSNCVPRPLGCSDEDSFKTVSLPQYCFLFGLHSFGLHILLLIEASSCVSLCVYWIKVLNNSEKARLVEVWFNSSSVLLHLHTRKHAYASTCGV